MKKLSDHAFNVHEQFGEDGIIEKIFGIIGVSSKICVEFGAWDGFHLSNTANLWAKKGWKGILMELDAERFKQLVENTKNYKCHCIQAKVEASGQNTLDEILKRAGVTEQVDLLSIDIDGDDYHIFNSLSETKPRLVICEYNPTIPPEIELVAEPGNYFGCSALSLVKLAEKKGYKLIAVTDTNCFFVRETEFSHFADYETSLPAIAVTKHLTYFVTGFSGDYLFSQKPVFGCGNPTSQKFTFKQGDLFFMPDGFGLSDKSNTDIVKSAECQLQKLNQQKKNLGKGADLPMVKKFIRHPKKTAKFLLQKAKAIIRHPRKAAHGIFPNARMFAKQAHAGGPLRLRRVKNASGGLDAEFLREIAARFDIKAFVETGTYFGETTAAAAKIFDQVYTIELSPELARQATVRLAPFPNVQVIEGDSSKALAHILPKLRGRALFWLDGHYSEGNTARGEGGNTPIIEELRAIQDAGIKDAIILVDDLHLFQKVTYQGSDAPSIYGYPDIHQLRQTIWELGENYQFFVLGACALAFPGSLNASAAPMLQALTVSRLSGGDKQALQEVIEAEAAIIRAGTEDREFLRDLHRQFVNSEKYGLGLHYRYWVALGNIGDKKFAEAAADLDALVKQGFDHCRLKFHLENSLKASGQASRVNPPLHLQPGQDALGILQAAGLWQPGQPLRLHLGCGENWFDSYVNIDYPPSEHSVQTKIGADIFADITSLNFPPQSVDEIRLHHVFEHFTRPQAMALLIRWHEWLKPGGKLHIETPDIMGCAEQLVSNIPYRLKQAVLRHCFGSHEAHWATHYDGWHAEKYQRVLTALGFTVECRRWRWPHEPYLANVEAFATKTRQLDRADLIAVADSILEEFMVAKVPSERAMWDIWRKQMRKLLNVNAQSGTVSQSNWKHRLIGLRICDESVETTAQGFNDDNPATNGEYLLLWTVLRFGDTVFDVGANIGQWSLQALEACQGLHLHAFEPFPDTFTRLQHTLDGFTAAKHQIAFSDQIGEHMFFSFGDDATLSGMNSLHRRPGVEEHLKISAAPTKVSTETLDHFCREHGVDKIHFLKLDVEGAELAVLRGAAELLNLRRIGLIQFEYGGTWKDAGAKLRDAFEILNSQGYEIHRVIADGLIHVARWNDALENFRYANYLAIAPDVE